MSAEAMREAFEAWALKRHLPAFLVRSERHGHYKRLDVNAEWEAWQAAHAKAVEDCAKACEGFLKKAEQDSNAAAYYVESCAAACRRLSTIDGEA